MSLQLRRRSFFPDGSAPSIADPPPGLPVSAAPEAAVRAGTWVRGDPEARGRTEGEVAGSFHSTGDVVDPFCCDEEPPAGLPTGKPPLPAEPREAAHCGHSEAAVEAMFVSALKRHGDASMAPPGGAVASAPAAPAPPWHRAAEHAWASHRRSW